MSDPGSQWSLPAFALMVSAWLVFKLLCLLFAAGVMMLFICVGPAVSMTGYIAIVRRLGDDRAATPVDVAREDLL